MENLLAHWALVSISMHSSIALVSIGLNCTDEQKLNHKVFSNFLPQHSEQSFSFPHPPHTVSVLLLKRLHRRQLFSPNNNNNDKKKRAKEPAAFHVEQNSKEASTCADF